MSVVDKLMLSMLSVTYTCMAAPHPACVTVTIVSGKGPEMDGKYVLKELVGQKPAEVCVDGCIYYKDDNREEEYCFKAAENLEESAMVQCEVKQPVNKTSWG